MLDTTIYRELEIEGWSRDLIRLIQQTRKERGLVITDRIKVEVHMSAEMSMALQPFVGAIQRETLAKDLIFTEAAPTNGVANEEIGEQKISLSLEVVDP